VSQRRPAERDPSLHELFLSLAEDLEVVDELTRFWIDNGPSTQYGTPST
jgi:hypothetical protein